jgi:hypothetical protein
MNSFDPQRVEASLYVCQYLNLCVIPVYASILNPMPGIDLKAGPVAELLKLIGATTVFGIGLYQYAQAQKWKRREFTASQFREFEADKSIQFVMTILDFTDRPQYFRSDIGGSPTVYSIGFGKPKWNSELISMMRSLRKQIKLRAGLD